MQHPQPLSQGRRISGAGPQKVSDVPGIDVVGRRDVRLMRRVAAGDEASLQELYDRYAGSVYAVAKQILRHAADAEEVVVDTFWEVWRKADRYDPCRGSVAGYVLLLARSRAIDRRRRVQSHEAAIERAKMHEADRSPGTNGECGDSASERAIEERREQIQGLLAELPREQRDAIELNVLKGLSHQQISHSLSVPLGTIKTRIRQGLIQLRGLLRNTERGPLL